MAPTRSWASRARPRSSAGNRLITERAETARRVCLRRLDWSRLDGGVEVRAGAPGAGVDGSRISRARSRGRLLRHLSQRPGEDRRVLARGSGPGSGGAFGRGLGKGGGEAAKPLDATPWYPTPRQRRLRRGGIVARAGTGPRRRRSTGSRSEE